MRVVELHATATGPIGLGRHYPRFFGSVVRSLARSYSPSAYGWLWRCVFGCGCFVLVIDDVRADFLTRIPCARHFLR